MLLAIDAGNTNLTIGVFDHDRIVTRWRLRTVHEQTSDEWGLKFRELLRHDDIDYRSIDGVVIASVVPPLESTLSAMSQRYFGTRPTFVNGESDTGLTLKVDNPKEVGADRIVNAVAALALYGGPCIVVDLGTAITFDAVSREREYLGGIICPGIGIALSGLFTKTARLPMVDFREPEKLIGTNTVGSIQAGVYYGAIGMIDGILDRMLAEMGPDTKTVATGGQAALITKGSLFLRQADEDLTLAGLQMIWERKRK
jgi:type III pantothenate kinase